jgi:hypothetical protein
MSNNGIIVAGVVLNVLSIAFFNYFGLSVTKTQSATTRMVLDSIRTVVIWAFTLAVGWEHVGFDAINLYLQYLGINLHYPSSYRVHVPDFWNMSLQ